MAHRGFCSLSILGFRHRGAIGGIEFVAGVASRIHQFKELTGAGFTAANRCR
jgi:hypothetical protein